MTSLTSNFGNTRFSVDENTRLSVSSWETASGVTYAVALLIKAGNGWEIRHDTAAEFVGADSREAGLPATDYGKTLVEGVLGSFPDRFYRDNAIGVKA